MSKSFKNIWNAITSILVVIAVILAIALAGVRVVGLQALAVLSGSMEPTYHVGSLIYVKKVDPMALKSGDVITFMLDEDTLATHRIVEVVPDEDDDTVLRFRTKGDANDVEDGGLVHYKNVVGTPVFTIPGLGYVADFIKKPYGTYMVIGIGALVVLITFLPDLFGHEDEPEKPAKKRKKRRRRGRGRRM